MPLEVGQLVERGGDVVDRHHVGVAEVDADERQPRGQAVAQHLDRGEGVVGPVGLVHGAGLAVTDHDRRPVDPPRHGRLVADELLGLELRPVVRRGEGLALVEHRLVERPVVLPGDRDRADLVEAAHPQRLGELERVSGAPDVHRLVGLVVGRQVVDRGEVEEVVDAAAVLVDPGLVDAEPVGSEVADDGHDPVGVPHLDHRLQTGERPLADQREDRALAMVEQLLDQVSSDESRGARDQVRHGRDPTRAGGRRTLSSHGPQGGGTSCASRALQRPGSVGIAGEPAIPTPSCSSRATRTSTVGQPAPAGAACTGDAGVCSYDDWNSHPSYDVRTSTGSSCTGARSRWSTSADGHARRSRADDGRSFGPFTWSRHME